MDYSTVTEERLSEIKKEKEIYNARMVGVMIGFLVMSLLILTMLVFRPDIMKVKYNDMNQECYYSRSAKNIEHCFPIDLVK